MLASGSSVEDEELTQCGTPGPEVHEVDLMQELATRQPPQVFRPADYPQGRPESLAAEAFALGEASEVLHRIFAVWRDVADLEARATGATAAQLVARRKELDLALAAVEAPSFPMLSAEEWALLFPPPSARGRPRPRSDALGELHARGTQSSSKATGANELSKLSGDEQRILFSQLCNVLDPGVAVALSSVSNELRAATLALLQQLKADHEAATALCRKLGKRSCKELRKVMRVTCWDKGLTADELALLGRLVSLLPAAESLDLREAAAGPDGVRRLVAGLAPCALPAVTKLHFRHTHVGDAGASALATALGQGAMPRLEHLSLTYAAIGDAGLVALAPALRRLPALEYLGFFCSPVGDEGLAALVAPPPPAGAPPPTTGGLAKLRHIILCGTQITNAGCATLAGALSSGALPALEFLGLSGIHASDAARGALRAARPGLVANLEPPF